MICDDAEVVLPDAGLVALVPHPNMCEGRGKVKRVEVKLASGLSHGATQLSRELASAVLAGQLAEAKTLAQAMRNAAIPAPTAMLAAETFAPSSPQSFASIVNAAWPAEERDAGLIVMPIVTGSRF